jgi:glycosyltransferase involved in cell wall biosynthesis
MLYDNLLGRQTEKLVTRLERMHLRRTQYCIGVSDFVLEATGKLVDLSDKTRHVVYNCVDTQHFCPSQGGRPAEQSIVFVNSLNQRKGLDALFQAMPDVLNQFPDVVLKLAGRGDEAYIEHLMGLIDSRFHKNIQFLGFVPRQDLPALLRQATLCCYPSLAETFGIAPVEAMAVGLPVIYTNLGPGPEILEHEVSGLLTDPRDPADIARQIKRILGNPEFARRIAANGRERVQEKFSTEIWLENNLNFYRDQVAVDFQLAGLRDPS